MRRNTSGCGARWILGRTTLIIAVESGLELKRAVRLEPACSARPYEPLIGVRMRGSGWDTLRLAAWFSLLMYAVLPYLRTRMEF